MDLQSVGWPALNFCPIWKFIVFFLRGTLLCYGGYFFNNLDQATIQ